MTSTLFSLFTHLHLWISLPLTPLPPLASLKCPCSAGWRWFKCLIRFIVRKFLWWSLHDFLWWSLSSLQVRSFHAKDMFFCGCEYAWQFICTTGHMLYMHEAGRLKIRNTQSQDCWKLAFSGPLLVDCCVCSILQKHKT